MNMHEDGRPALQEQVAEEIRVQLARRRVSGRKLARELGWTAPYLSRRMNGRQSFTVEDLDAISRFLRASGGAWVIAASRSASRIGRGSLRVSEGARPGRTCQPANPL